MEEMEEGVRVEGVSCKLPAAAVAAAALPGAAPHLRAVRISMRLLRPPCGCFTIASATAFTSPDAAPTHTTPLSSIVMHLREHAFD